MMIMNAGIMGKGYMMMDRIDECRECLSMVEYMCREYLPGDSGYAQRMMEWVKRVRDIINPLIELDREIRRVIEMGYYKYCKNGDRDTGDCGDGEESEDEEEKCEEKKGEEKKGEEKKGRDSGVEEILAGMERKGSIKYRILPLSSRMSPRSIIKSPLPSSPLSSHKPSSNHILSTTLSSPLKSLFRPSTSRLNRSSSPNTSISPPVHPGGRVNTVPSEDTLTLDSVLSSQYILPTVPLPPPLPPSPAHSPRPRLF